MLWYYTLNSLISSAEIGLKLLILRFKHSIRNILFSIQPHSRVVLMKMKYINAVYHIIWSKISKLYFKSGNTTARASLVNIGWINVHFTLRMFYGVQLQSLHREFPSNYSMQLVYKIYFKINAKSPSGQWARVTQCYVYEHSYLQIRSDHIWGSIHSHSVSFRNIGSRGRICCQLHLVAALWTDHWKRVYALL